MRYGTVMHMTALAEEMRFRLKAAPILVLAGVLVLFLLMAVACAPVPDEPLKEPVAPVTEADNKRYEQLVREARDLRPRPELAGPHAYAIV